MTLPIDLIVRKFVGAQLVDIPPSKAIFANCWHLLFTVSFAKRRMRLALGLMQDWLKLHDVEKLGLKFTTQNVWAGTGSQSPSFRPRYENTQFCIKRPSWAGKLSPPTPKALLEVEAPTVLSQEQTQFCTNLSMQHCAHHAQCRIHRLDQCLPDVRAPLATIRVLFGTA